MPYNARFSKIFLKKQKRLPDNFKQRAIQTVKEILIRPQSGIMLVGPLKGLWKIRIGKYRILYEINEEEKVVIFHDIALRKKVYE
jgi:mRNA interferase RelE/StbE